MPTKKQRRRRAKERRHDWEYVYVDEEGREVEVEEETAPDKASGSNAKDGSKAAGKTSARGGRTGRAGQRTVEPASWQRVLRRAAIFAPVMFLVIHFLSPNLGLQQKLVQTAVLIAFFIPFSYFMDTMMYRMYRKRTGNPVKPGEKTRRSAGARDKKR